jgi:hypothetical protein
VANTKPRREKPVAFLVSGPDKQILAQKVARVRCVDPQSSKVLYKVGHSCRRRMRVRDGLQPKVGQHLLHVIRIPQWHLRNSGINFSRVRHGLMKAER